MTGKAEFFASLPSQHAFRARLDREIELLRNELDEDECATESLRMLVCRLDNGGDNLAGRWGLYGVLAQFTLHGNDLGGNCVFQLREGGVGSDEDDDEEEDSNVESKAEETVLTIQGAWHRDPGSSELPIKFDVNTLMLTGPAGFKSMRDFLKESGGAVRGQVRTMDDFSPFGLLLHMPQPSIEDPDPAFPTCPWIFNCYSTLAEAAEADKGAALGEE